MKISLKVTPKSKENKILWEGERLLVWLKAPPQEGKANEALISILSEFFKVSKDRIRIMRGERSRLKIIEIEGFNHNYAKE